MMTVTYMISHNLFVFALLFQLSHHVLGRNQHLGILLQKLSEILEQRMLRPKEVELKKIFVYFLLTSRESHYCILLTDWFARKNLRPHNVIYNVYYY